MKKIEAMNEFDIAVVGEGLAGSVAALALARAGRNPEVAAALGQPLRAKPFPFGSINQFGDGGGLVAGGRVFGLQPEAPALLLALVRGAVRHPVGGRGDRLFRKKS